MKRLVLSFVLFLIAANLFSQSKFSTSAAFGVINAFGDAKGIELGCKQLITEHLSFQLIAGYYTWSSKKDLNAPRWSAGQTFSSLDYNLHHVKMEINSLTPIRFGFNYLVGNFASHPFFGVYWSLNMISGSVFQPLPVSDTTVPFSVAYSQATSSTVFATIGFDLGYSVYLTNEMNAVAGVKYQTGKAMDYVAFVGGIEYQF